MKTYHFDYTFDPETAEYFDESLRDEMLEVSYEVVAGHVHITEVKMRTPESYNHYIDILPVLLAFKGAKILERAAYSNYEMRQQEKIFKAYPELAKNHTQEEILEMLKLK